MLSVAAAFLIWKGWKNEKRGGAKGNCNKSYTLKTDFKEKACAARKKLSIVKAELVRIN